MSKVLDIENGIDFLIARRFACASVARLSTSDNNRIADDVVTYRLELESLPSTVLQKIITEERRKVEAEKTAEAERQEQSRFFNQPYACCDYSFWCRAACWKLPEANALALGKDPEVVNWDTLKGLVGQSSFADRFRRLRDLITRSHLMNYLANPVIPGDLIIWAEQNRIELPSELVSGVADQVVPPRMEA